jgi:hypothetical protein
LRAQRHELERRAGIPPPAVRAAKEHDATKKLFLTKAHARVDKRGAREGNAHSGREKK